MAHDKKVYLLGQSGRELFWTWFCWRPFQKLFPRNYKRNRNKVDQNFKNATLP